MEATIGFYLLLMDFQKEAQFIEHFEDGALLEWDGNAMKLRAPKTDQVWSTKMERCMLHRKMRECGWEKRR